MAIAYKLYGQRVKIRDTNNISAMRKVDDTTC